jgi:hypothetical protein
MDHVRDNLEAMILLEKKFYHCEDYLETDQPEPTYSPLHVVAEMAKLVTDIQFLDMNPLLSSSSKGGGTRENNKSVSPASSVHDLYAMQTSQRRFTYELYLLSAWRQQMYSWTRIVVCGLHLDRDTMAVAFSTLDRFLAIKLRDNDEISKENFQLYSMVSLYFSENGCIDPKTKIDECGQNFARVVSSGTNYGCRARDPQSIAMACKSTDGHGILRIVFALVCLRSAS